MAQRTNLSIKCERRAWTQKEDQALIELIKLHGLKNWAINDLENNVERGYKQLGMIFKNYQMAQSIEPKYQQEAMELRGRGNYIKSAQNYWKQVGRNFQITYPTVSSQINIILDRTDNSIKNHFYATLRRSLRKINKLLGDRNSTSQINDIKPGVLSKIFELAEKNDTESIEDLHGKEFLPNCDKLKEYLLKFAHQKQNEQKNEELIKIFKDEKEISLLRKGIQNIIEFNQIYQQDKLTKQQRNILISEANECTENLFINQKQQFLAQNEKIKKKSLIFAKQSQKQESLEQNVSITEKSSIFGKQSQKQEQNVSITEKSQIFGKQSQKKEQNVSMTEKLSIFGKQSQKQESTDKINNIVKKYKKKESLFNQMLTVSQKKDQKKQEQILETQLKIEYDIKGYLERFENLKNDIKLKNNKDELQLKCFDDFPTLSEYEIDSDLDVQFDYLKGIEGSQIKNIINQQEVKINSNNNKMKNENFYFSYNSNFKLSKNSKNQKIKDHQIMESKIK